MRNEAPVPEKPSENERTARIVAGFALVGTMAVGSAAAIAFRSHVPDWICILVIAISLIGIPLNWEECVNGLARAFARIKQRRR